MALGWMTVLRLVPWGEVINNAPKVADGARKLWNSVARKPAPAEAPPADVSTATLSDAEAIALLQARLAAAEASVAELHQQLLASSKLLTEVADQNAALIKRVEAVHLRVWCLFVAVGVLSILLAGQWWGWFPHS